MAFETITPNMSLPIPAVGSTIGPDYATDINSSLTLVDQHDHTPGRGAAITPSAISITQDLPFNNNNATLLRSTRFQNQGAVINGASDLGCLYRAGNDLYYNDGAGNQIRMTISGSVAGSAGTITGLPNGTASANYSAGVFTFQSATNTSANLDFGSAILRNNTASSFGITLSPPTLAANYSIILPALPGSTSAVNITSSGTMSTITYDGIGSGMTATGANAIAATMTSTGANAIATTMTSTGVTTLGGKIQSEIWLIAKVAYGSTNTRVFRFGTVQVNNPGTSLTLSQSSTLGDSITINVTGVYACSAAIACNLGADGSLVRNGTVEGPTLSATIMGYMNNPNSGNDQHVQCTYTGVLNAGDVIRVCGNTTNSNSASSQLHVTRIF